MCKNELAKQAPLTPDELGSVVIDVENLIGGHSQKDNPYILMTANGNAMHFFEDKAEWNRIQEEYIRALCFLSAVEEEFHGETVGKLLRSSRQMCERHDARRP
jgi:hypothetical protein